MVKKSSSATWRAAASPSSVAAVAGVDAEQRREAVEVAVAVLVPDVGALAADDDRHLARRRRRPCRVKCIHRCRLRELLEVRRVGGRLAGRVLSWSAMSDSPFRTTRTPRQRYEPKRTALLQASHGSTLRASCPLPRMLYERPLVPSFGRIATWRSVRRERHSFVTSDRVRGIRSRRGATRVAPRLPLGSRGSAAVPRGPAARRQGPEDRGARLPLEPGHRRRLDGARRTASRRPSGSWSPSPGGRPRAGRDARLVPADAADRRGLQLHEQGRPRLRHELHLGDPGDGAAARLADRLGDRRRRRRS